MNTVEKIDENISKICVNDAINGEESEVINTRLEHLIHQGLNRLIVDCSALTFVNSTGLATLLLTHNRILCRKGNVRLFAVPQIVREVLTITRLDTLFHIDPDENSAKSAFTSEK